MPDQKEALGLELRQIIQADRMATDIIQNANYMRRSIEAKTDKDKARIMEEAKQQHQQITQTLQAQQADELAQRKKDAIENNKDKQQALAQLMEENQQEWAAQMVQRITAL